VAIAAVYEARLTVVASSIGGLGEAAGTEVASLWRLSLAFVASQRGRSALLPAWAFLFEILWLLADLEIMCLLPYCHTYLEIMCLRPYISSAGH
jgi:hypothetical protein